MATTKKEVKTFLLPIGRLINEALFEKDVYTDARGKEGTPYYKLELAFEPKDVEGEGTIEDALIDAAIAEWGDAAEDWFIDGKIKSPFLSGDKLAQKRAEKGKEGDAYKGKIVIRANTIYNFNGQDAPGGIQVYDENVKQVTAANRQAIYPGCFGQAAVTISPYLDNAGEKALKFYLSAFQKTGDGEPLVATKDHSALFKPVSKPTGGEAEPVTGRRRRA